MVDIVWGLLGAVLGAA